jgi:peptide/nickel transport system permease protein
MTRQDLRDSWARRQESLRKGFYRFSRNPVSVVGLVVVALVALVAVFGPSIAPYPQHARAYVNFGDAKQPPNRKYLFGTDIIGRDILSRLLFAVRPAVLTGVLVQATVVPIGTVLGMIGGYFPGTWISTLIMRAADVFVSVPALILALAVCAVLQPTFTNSMIAVSIASWPWYGRLVYGMTSSLRNEYFVKAAELAGASKARILFREILPNVVSPLLTKVTLDIPYVIMLSASLSYVGLGEQPPIPSLGNMVSDGVKYIPDQWWIVVAPALAIVVIVLGFNLLGDGLRDMLAMEDS